MTKSNIRRFMPLLVAAALLLAPRASLQAQSDSWGVTSLEHLDLWYHGLAVVGFQGFAPLPMYSAEYAAEIRDAKEEMGVYPTPLDTLAGRFRRAFATDSTFEVLHFLPVYFASSNRVAMLAALRAATEGDDVAGPLEQFGTSVAINVLTTDRQRAALADFIAALEAEWELFYRSYRGRLFGEVDPVLTNATDFWNGTVVPALQPYLEYAGLGGGLVVVSPALGAEGRIFKGTGSNDADNVIVVGLPRNSDARTVAISAVRESCFPLVSALVSRQSFMLDRQLAEQASSRGAVRCGALVLDRYLPELAAEYRNVFLGFAPNVNPSTTIESAFPVDRQLITAIITEIQR